MDLFAHAFQRNTTITGCIRHVGKLATAFLAVPSQNQFYIRRDVCPAELVSEHLFESATFMQPAELASLARDIYSSARDSPAPLATLTSLFAHSVLHGCWAAAIDICGPHGALTLPPPTAEEFSPLGRETTFLTLLESIHKWRVVLCAEPDDEDADGEAPGDDEDFHTTIDEGEEP
jgi:hypothetical protein